jgi:hypothetical protein
MLIETWSARNRLTHRCKIIGNVRAGWFISD